MIVKVYKHHLDYFKKKCKLSKNEEYAVLLGYRISPTLVEIHKWCYPELGVKTPGNIETAKGAIEQVQQLAKELGMVVIGDIHSHINDDVAMSRTDFIDHKKQQHCITGILSVNKHKISLAFWEIDSPLPASIKYITKLKKSRGRC